MMDLREGRFRVLRFASSHAAIHPKTPTYRKFRKPGQRALRTLSQPFTMELMERSKA